MSNAIDADKSQKNGSKDVTKRNPFFFTADATPPSSPPLSPEELSLEVPITESTVLGEYMLSIIGHF